MKCGQNSKYTHRPSVSNITDSQLSKAKMFLAQNWVPDDVLQKYVKLVKGFTFLIMLIILQLHNIVIF